MPREYRKFTRDGLKVTRSKDSDDLVLSGYFVRYNIPEPYSDYDDQLEKVSPGVFGSSLNRDIRCLYNHNTDFVLGRTSNGTLTLEERPDGLYGSVKINKDDTEALNIYRRVERGDVSGCSFGAYIIKEDYSASEKTWTLEDADLIEVSVCPFPFYDSTVVEARAKTLTHNKRLSQAKSLKAKLIKRRLSHASKWTRNREPYQS